MTVNAPLQPKTEMEKRDYYSGVQSGVTSVLSPKRLSLDVKELGGGDVVSERGRRPRNNKRRSPGFQLKNFIYR